MCRLLGYVTAGAQSMSDAVGGRTLADFRALAGLHGDGWGAAWVCPEEAAGVAVHRSTAAAVTDPEFDATTGAVAARAAFVHLRWATVGIPVSPANTHPFVADGWAFAHNGFIRDSDRIADLLPARHRAALRGTTDSERYFRLVLHSAEQTGDIVTGLQRAGRLVLDLIGQVSINAMLLSSSRFLAVQGLSGARPPLQELLAQVGHPDRLPLDHGDNYFGLAYRELGGTLVVASSGMPREGWTPLGEDSVMDIDIAAGDWTVRPLLAGAIQEPGENAWR
jgi:predicted glutamine amidotransferase